METGAFPKRPVTQRRWPACISLVVGCLLCSLSAATDVVTIKLNDTLTTGGDVKNAMISPDGQWVVYRADQDTNDAIELYSVPIDGGTPTRLNGPLPAASEVLYAFDISPDSARVVYAAPQDTTGKVELYNRVASASVNRAHNWGGMLSIEEAGIDEYVFHAVMDERTSRICRELDGRVFSVPRVMKVVRQALERPPSAIESIAPWPTFDTERKDLFIQAGERRTYLKGKSSDWLADHGVALPPLHGNCRSVVILRR